MKVRHGHSLVELTATLATLAILAILAGGLFRIASRTAMNAADRAEALDATRTAAALLGRELHPLAQGDFGIFGDSIALRAFRGYAVPCDTSHPARMRYTGARPPDPTKDSVLALGDSTETVAALSAATPASPAGTCTPLPGEQLYTLTASTPLPAATAWLVFEAGTYSIGSGALRYRRGFGGRQPVTAAAFDDATSGFAADTAGVLMFLAPAHAHAHSFALPTALRLPLPNTDSTVTP